MKKKILILSIMALGMFTQGWAQTPATPVGIGTRKADPSSVLELKSTTQGFLMPRLTKAQRDAINNPALGLTIFDTDNNCIESWTGTDWVGNCGVSPAEFSITDCSSVSITGSYLQGTPLDASNMLVMTVNVAKPGTYTINAQPNPANGYYFNTTGTFSAKGNAKVVIYGLGTPTNPTPTNGTRKDTIRINMNNQLSNCYVTTSVAANTIPSNFTASCSDVQVYGVGKKGTPLTTTNYITVKVSGGTMGAPYNISTNTVDGISFSGTGTITQNPQTILLSGNGTPTPYGTKNLTISFNNKDAVPPNTTCAVNYVVATPALNIASFHSVNGYGFAAEAGAPNRIASSTKNFGTSPTSTVSSLGLSVTYIYNNSISSVTGSGNPPDIIIIGYAYDAGSATNAPALKSYLAAGGIVLCFQEAGATLNTLQGIFGYTGLANPGQAGGSYAVTGSDPIINGPFGNVSGSNWGDDAVNSCYGVTGIPAGDITVYSTGSTDAPIFFRHNTKSFIWAGNGGFLTASDLNGFSNSTTRGPVVADANGVPMSKPYSNSKNVDNAKLFANMLAWAINQAMTNGINKSKF